MSVSSSQTPTKLAAESDASSVSGPAAVRIGGRVGARILRQGTYAAPVSGKSEAFPLKLFDPKTTIQLQGFSNRAATAVLHNATETSFEITGIFQGAEDFANVQLFAAHDYYHHLRNKPLARRDLSGVTLQFDMELNVVNSDQKEGNVRPDSQKFPTIAWDKMTLTDVGGDIYEIPLMPNSSIVSGGITPATFDLRLVDREEAVLDSLLIGNPTPALTDTVYVYFDQTRWSCSSAEAISFCNLETTTTAAIPAGLQTVPVVSSAEIQVGDYIGIDISGTNDEVVKVLAVGANSFTAFFLYSHAAGVAARTLPRSRHFGRVLKSRMVDAPAPDYGVQPDSLLFDGETSTLSSWEMRVKLGGTIAERGEEANSIPVSISVHPGNQIVRLPVVGAVTSQRLFLSGGANDRVYRFFFNFDALQGYKNGDFLTLVPVPVTSVQKLHLTFAPRFENIEEALRNGGTLNTAVPASPPGTVEEWQVLGGERMQPGNWYYVGTATSEEKILCLSNLGVVKPVPLDPGTWYWRVMVRRGEDGTVPAAWAAGTRVQEISPITGFRPDLEWSVRISNIAVTGDRTLAVGGDDPRIEENDNACIYEGPWETYTYGAGWPTQWWSGGYARRTARTGPSDTRLVRISYTKDETHDLYLGTWFGRQAGKIRVSIDDGPPDTLDLYMDDFNGTAGNIRLASDLAAGSHTVVIEALWDKHPNSTGYWVYFDYLWPVSPKVFVPKPPKIYNQVSAAIDFGTDHGYKKPPAWHVWQLNQLGFLGHANVYMSVFWNNKRRRINATFPSCRLTLTSFTPDVPVSINLGGTNIFFSPGHGMTVPAILQHLRGIVNSTFPGVWSYVTGSDLHIQSRAPGYTFTISASSHFSITQGSPALHVAGQQGDWQVVDKADPVLTLPVKRWIRDLAAQFRAANIPATFAFSMEVYLPPPEMRARYLRLLSGVVTPGEEVLLPVPAHHMHFGVRVREFMRRMYKECADEIAAAGLPIILQFGETQWWYFDNKDNDLHGPMDPNGGMPYYDQETIDDYFTEFGVQIYPFEKNTDSPSLDLQTANFLKNRLWAYCQDVMNYVRQFHPSAAFECLWPLDANQGKPAPDPAFRALNFHVNLPDEWKTSAAGIRNFRSEGFDYDVWQRNMSLVSQAISIPLSFGRRPSECFYLSGIFGPPSPLIRESYAEWRKFGLNSMAFWALDQFCLNSQPLDID